MAAASLPPRAGSWSAGSTCVLIEPHFESLFQEDTENVRVSLSSYHSPGLAN